MALVQGVLRKGSDAAEWAGPAPGEIPGWTPQGKTNEDMRVIGLAHPEQSRDGPGNSDSTL
jgi:hypothetical protein